MKHLKPKGIQVLLDGEASENKRLWAERHVRSCAGCKGRMEEAEQVLKAVRRDLESLNPASIPSPTPFNPQLAKTKDPRKRLVQAYVLAPVKVPAFLLVLTGGMLVLLMGLYSVERARLRDAPVSRDLGAGQGILTITSAEGQSKIVLNAPAERFRPVDAPLIFVLQKEVNHE